MLNDTYLTLHVHSSSTVKTVDNKHINIANIKHGDVIRCVIRIQGVSRIMNKNDSHYRIHHSVPAMCKVSM
jgi:hypothetical protein